MRSDFEIRPNVDKIIGFFSLIEKTSLLVACIWILYILFGLIKCIILHIYLFYWKILYTFALKSEIYCTMKYGELIKERRAVLGLTQQDLSDYTELSLRIIKSVESEKGNPSLKTLEKIADVLGLELIMRVKIINE